MTVKANWFEGSVDTQAAGPDVTRVGRLVDLLGPEELNVKLAALMRDESELYNEGITCPIKDHDASSCVACPIRETDPLERLEPLCTIGVEQDKVITALLVHAHAPGR